MEVKELHQKMYLEVSAKPEYIICAAIHFDDGLKHAHQPVNIKSGFVLCGRRHHNVFVSYSILAFGTPKNEKKQGFLTSKDRFVDREEAGSIALSAGQINEPNNCLFSEDLY
jgi:hypothetical protein